MFFRQSELFSLVEYIARSAHFFKAVLAVIANIPLQNVVSNNVPRGFLCQHKFHLEKNSNTSSGII